MSVLLLAHGYGVPGWLLWSVGGVALGVLGAFGWFVWLAWKWMTSR